MSAWTLAQILAHARLLALDSSATDPPGYQVSDTQANAIINECLTFAWNFFGPRRGYLKFSNDANLLVNSSSAFLLTTSFTQINELVGVHYEAGDSTATDGVALQKVEYHEILEMRRRSATVGTPRYWHGQRVAVDQAGVPGSWTIYWHPPVASGAKYFSLRVRLDRTVQDPPDLTLVETRLVARLAGWEIASKLGRDPDVLDLIASIIPEEVRAARGIKLHTGIGVASVDNG